MAKSRIAEQFCTTAFGIFGEAGSLGTISKTQAQALLMLVLPSRSCLVVPVGDGTVDLRHGGIVPDAA